MAVTQTSFNERIKSIRNPRNTFYVDPETGTFIPKRVSRNQIRQAKAAKYVPKAGIAGMMGSLILGGVCLMMARYLRTQHLGMQDGGGEADVLMMIDFGLAAMVVFIVGAMVKHTSVRHMVAQTAGIGVMLVSMHNLIWAFPEEFAQVYSPAYVEQVRATTSPQSLYVRGETITL